MKTNIDLHLHDTFSSADQLPNCLCILRVECSEQPHVSIIQKASLPDWSERELAGYRERESPFKLICFAGQLSELPGFMKLYCST